MDGMESLFSSTGDWLGVVVVVDEAVFDARLYFRENEADIMVLGFSDDAVGGNARGDDEESDEVVVGDEGALWRDGVGCVF